MTGAAAGQDRPGAGGPRRIAYTRAVSASIARCELSHVERQPIDLERARRQHAAYEATLREAGFDVRRLPALDEHPDAVFVEDTAIVLDELAVITRPGAQSRRDEIVSVEVALAAHRPIVRIAAPATVDGGDVLVVGREVYVGRSVRTDAEGVAQLRAHLRPLGYEVHAVPVRGCLHLKTAVSAFAPGRLVVNPDWVDVEVFARHAPVPVHPSEPFAANVLALSGRVVVPTAHPATAARLRAEGASVVSVDADELARAEGGLTCCSLLLEDPTS